MSLVLARVLPSLTDEQSFGLLPLQTLKMKNIFKIIPWAKYFSRLLLYSIILIENLYKRKHSVVPFGKVCS